MAQAEGLRDGYRPNSLLLSKCVHSVQRAAAFLCEVGLMMATKNASIDVVKSNARSQYTRRRRRWDLDHTERLREGYR